MSFMKIRQRGSQQKKPSKIWQPFTPFLLTLSLCSHQVALASNWTVAPGAWKEDDSQAHRVSRKIESKANEVSPFSPGSHNLAVDLGQVFLMGDLTRFSDTIGTQLHYTYGVSELFGFDSSIGYSHHADGHFTLATVVSGMRLNLAWYDKLVPYGVFGLGFYRPYYSDPTQKVITQPNGDQSIASLSSLLFGLHIGPGIDLELSKNVYFGAGLTFHNMFGTNKTWPNGANLYLGGFYTTFLLHIGATF